MKEETEKNALTTLQIELLKVFNFEVSENQLLEIRMLLADYFAKKITDETDKIWIEKSWNQETIEQWTTEHMRKK